MPKFKSELPFAFVGFAKRSQFTVKKCLHTNSSAMYLFSRLNPVPPSTHAL